MQVSSVWNSTSNDSQQAANDSDVDSTTTAVLIQQDDTAFNTLRTMIGVIGFITNVFVIFVFIRYTDVKAKVCIDDLTTAMHCYDLIHE